MLTRVAGSKLRKFPKNLGGFTVVELVTVLAVTGILFIAVVSLVQTQNARTQFAQAINDLDNRLNQYVTEIHSGVDPTAEKYNCKGYPDAGAINGRPTLYNSPSGIGTSGGCLFLGKAIQVNPGSAQAGQLYAYTVLGNRTMADPGGGPNPVPIDTFADSNPEPTYTSLNVSAADDMSTYSIPFGVKVLSSHYNSDPSILNSNLVGFYNGLDSSIANAQVSKAYSPAGGLSSTGSSLYSTSCIEENTAAATANCPPANDTYVYPAIGGSKTFNRWDLCLSYANITGVLSVYPTSAGIRTQITYKKCT